MDEALHVGADSFPAKPSENPKLIDNQYSMCYYIQDIEETISLVA